jgi:hypothetical protein
MTNRPPIYSDPWIGKDGNEWRQVKYWVGVGYVSFLQVKRNGQWHGW